MRLPFVQIATLISSFGRSVLQCGASGALALSVFSAPARAQETDAHLELLKTLDSQLLGNWGKLSDTATKNLTRVEWIRANNACKVVLRITNAQFETGAVRALPKTSQRHGNIIYYRTSSGLQRLDTALRQVNFIKSISVENLDQNRKIWTLRNAVGSVKLAFARPVNDSRQLPLFLIEGNAIYLRCQRNNSK